MDRIEKMKHLNSQIEMLKEGCILYCSLNAEHTTQHMSQVYPNSYTCEDGPWTKVYFEGANLLDFLLFMCKEPMYYLIEDDEIILSEIQEAPDFLYFNPYAMSV